MEFNMYEFNEYDKVLRDFETRVSVIVNMEIADKITPEQAYKQIKENYAILKKYRKKHKNDPT
jgi:hypothetical protein